MKRLILASAFLGLLSGCGDEEEAFPEIINPLDSPEARQEALAKALLPDALSNLPGDVELDEPLSFQEDAPKNYFGPDGSPYSGWVKNLYPSGEVASLFECREGKQDGLHTAWYDGGGKMIERTWVAGVREGPFIAWSPSGEVDYRGYNMANLRDGKFEDFYPGGRKKTVLHYQAGKVMEAQRWKPDGAPCPLTSLSNGSGMIVHYHDDENVTIDFNETFVDGEIDYGPQPEPLLPEPVPVVVDPSEGNASPAGAGNELNSSAP